MSSGAGALPTAVLLSLLVAAASVWWFPLRDLALREPRVVIAYVCAPADDYQPTRNALVPIPVRTISVERPRRKTTDRR